MRRTSHRNIEGNNTLIGVAYGSRTGGLVWPARYSALIGFLRGLTRAIFRRQEQAIQRLAVPCLEPGGAPAAVGDEKPKCLWAPDGIQDVGRGLQVQALPQAGGTDHDPQQLALARVPLDLAELAERGDVRIGRCGAADDLVHGSPSLEDRTPAPREHPEAAVGIGLAAHLLHFSQLRISAACPPAVEPVHLPATRSLRTYSIIQ